MMTCAHCGTERPGWQLMVVVNSATGVSEPICTDPWDFECSGPPPAAAEIAALVRELLDVPLETVSDVDEVIAAHVKPGRRPT